MSTSVNSAEFRRLLSRNVALPLGLAILLVFVFLGVLGYLLQVSDEITRYDTALKRETEALKHVVDAETGVRGFLATGDKRFLEPYLDAERSLPPIFADMETHALQLTGRTDLPRSIMDRYHHWDATAKGWFPKLGSARSVDVQLDGKAQMDYIRSLFTTYETNLETVRTRLTEESSRQARWIAALTALFTLLVGAGLAVLGRRQLLGLSASYESALGAQLEQNTRLTEIAWIRAGLADLSIRVRGELDQTALGRAVLDFFAGYVGCDLGALYVNSEGNKLARVADLGLTDEARAAAPAVLAYGDGLVGAAAAQKKLQTRGDLPEGYFRAVSATGGALPRRLALLPATADGEVNGVIELAFLRDVPPRTIELLEGAAEVVGGAVRSMLSRHRLQQALEESQQLGEELQAQQEELRVANEELEERTKVLQEAQQRLEGQHAELEQTNEQLEETATELEEQKRILDDKNRSLQGARVELERKAEELATSSRYKSEFLANMSHELRTPLNSSLILAKLLMDNLEGNLTPEQVEFATTIHSAGNDLLVLINDILDLSKVEAGKIDIHPEPVNLASVGEGLMREFRVQAESKGVELRLATEPGAPATIRTDRQRLEQVLRNLIGNAVKFTAGGFVELAVTNGRGGGAVFRVRDTGIGIEPAQHAAIFEAFHQADGTTSRKYGGTGLGLSISSKLVELLGGTISVESAPGKGSTFSMALPADVGSGTTVPASPVSATLPSSRPVADATAERRPPRTLADDRDAPDASGKRFALIVEDDPGFARILLDLAHESGLFVLLADTIAEAEELVAQRTPVVVVLDIKLPDGSGLSLLDRLKNNPKTRHIPVHGLSITDYSHEALHHGAAGFTLKPAHAQELRGFFTSILSRLENSVKRVLLVEDDPVQLKSVSRLIDERGVEIVPAATGQEAIAALTSGTAFDCVIMDLRLPDMPGTELLDKVTRDRITPMPPVIVYTGKEIDRTEEETLLRHSRSIIIKGARSPERLLEEVTLFLHKPEAELSPEQRLLLRSSRNREKAFEGRTILVVDDDVRNVFALTNALEHKGARALIARNGREAVEKVDQDEAIDLVLMDIMMPEMDGLEATRRIRAGRRKDIPIIAVTAKAMADDFERCLQAGANDYLAKPVNVERLVSLIRVWLPKRMGAL